MLNNCQVVFVVTKMKRLPKVQAIHFWFSAYFRVGEKGHWILFDVNSLIECNRFKQLSEVEKLGNTYVYTLHSMLNEDQFSRMWRVFRTSLYSNYLNKCLAFPTTGLPYDKATFET